MAVVEPLIHLRRVANALIARPGSLGHSVCFAARYPAIRRSTSVAANERWNCQRMAIDCLRLYRKLSFESFAVQLSALGRDQTPDD